MPATLNVKRREWYSRYSKAYEAAKERAATCEAALQLQPCDCVCGGRYHGKKHPPMFIAEYAARLAAQNRPDTETIDLFSEWGTPCEGGHGGT